MKTYKVELTHEEILNLQSGCVEVWTNKANPKRVQEDTPHDRTPFTLLT